MNDPQYENHGGLLVDMDIELVFSYVVDRNYTDPYLDRAFWVIVDTYFRGEIASQVERISVRSLIETESAELLLRKSGIKYKVIHVSEDYFPKSIIGWFNGVEYAASLHTPFGNTEMVPGVSRSHALTLAMMQRARHISRLHLNPAEFEGVSKH